MTYSIVTHAQLADRARRDRLDRLLLLELAALSSRTRRSRRGSRISGRCRSRSSSTWCGRWCVALFIVARRRASTVITAMAACIAAVARLALRARRARQPAAALLPHRRARRRAARRRAHCVSLDARIGSPAARPRSRRVARARVRDRCAWSGSRATTRFLFNGGFTAFAIAVAVMLLAIVEADWLSKRVLTFGAVARRRSGLVRLVPLALLRVHDRRPEDGCVLDQRPDRDRVRDHDGRDALLVVRGRAAVPAQEATNARAAGAGCPLNEAAGPRQSGW